MVLTKSSNLNQERLCKERISESFQMHAVIQSSRLEVRSCWIVEMLESHFQEDLHGATGNGSHEAHR